MATKIRKQIYLDSEHEAILKQLSADMGISEAEIIRQAVERYSLAVKPGRRNLKAWEDEKAFIQQLIERNSAQDPVSTKFGADGEHSNRREPAADNSSRSSAGDRRETTAPTWNREDLYDRKILRGQ